MATFVYIQKKKKKKIRTILLGLDDRNPAFNIFWESATLLLVTKMFVSTISITITSINQYKNKQWWCWGWNLFAWDAVEYAVENKFFE